MTLIHGTVVAVAGAGVLLRGAPGSGKSSLALRLVDMPGFGLGQELLRAGLVADDQVLLTKTPTGLMASAPPNLAGLLEIRGLGLVKLPHLAEIQVKLVVDLTEARNIPRMPEASELVTMIEGVSLRRMMLDAADAAGPAKIRANLL